MSSHRTPGPAEGDLGRIIPSPRARLWAYGVVAAGLALAGGYGLLAEEDVPRWLDLADALLAPAGLALAAANVPARRREGSGADRVGR